MSYTTGTGTATQTLALDGTNQTITINAATIDTTITLDSVNIGLTGCKTILGTSGTVVVNPNPTATLTVSDTTICNGGTARIVVSNTELGVKYQLRDGTTGIGSGIPGNGTTITFIISPTDTTIYNIYATDTTTTSMCEVELTDKAEVNVVNCDFGDLPDGTTDTLAGDYQTLLANGGPVHYIRTDLKLGLTIDNEPDGQESPQADGDGDDEDGITFFSSLNIVPGGTIRLPISIVNGTASTAYLEGWIDWNADGKFSGMDEMVTDTDDTAFPGYVTINVPDNVANMTDIGVRFRLSLQDNMTPYGVATSGEIEDYIIQIDCATGICLPISSTVIRGTKD